MYTVNKKTQRIQTKKTQRIQTAFELYEDAKYHGDYGLAAIFKGYIYRIHEEQDASNKGSPRSHAETYVRHATSSFNKLGYTLSVAEQEAARCLIIEDRTI